MDTIITNEARPALTYTKDQATSYPIPMVFIQPTAIARCERNGSVATCSDYSATDQCTKVENDRSDSTSNRDPRFQNSPKSELERGRQMDRKLLDPDQSKSRRSVSWKYRSPSRGTSAHAGIHFLTAVQNRPASPMKAQQTDACEAAPAEPACRFSYEDQKHVQMMKWLSSSRIY